MCSFKRQPNASQNRAFDSWGKSPVYKLMGCSLSHLSKILCSIDIGKRLEQTTKKLGARVGFSQTNSSMHLRLCPNKRKKCYVSSDILSFQQVRLSHFHHPISLRRLTLDFCQVTLVDFCQVTLCFCSTYLIIRSGSLHNSLSSSIVLSTIPRAFPKSTSTCCKYRLSRPWMQYFSKEVCGSQKLLCLNLRQYSISLHVFVFRGFPSINSFSIGPVKTIAELQ